MSYSGVNCYSPLQLKFAVDREMDSDGRVLGSRYYTHRSESLHQLISALYFDRSDTRSNYLFALPGARIKQPPAITVRNVQ